MPYISKAQIEQLKEAFYEGEYDDTQRAHRILDSLLEQGEVQPVSIPQLTAQELSALTRFCETCEDNEGYDVPKTMMQRLAQIGVVRHLSKGIYGITEFGQAAIDGFTHPPTPKLVPMDLDLARAMCRGAGISLVSRDFIERFADFVSDWRKGDFMLPRYAELDMKSCFDAWQAFDPDLAIAHPTPKALVTAEDVPDKAAIDLWRVGVLTSTGTQGKDIIAKVVNAFNGLALEASK